MAGRWWTEREEKLLKELYPHLLAGEMSVEELCRVLNRTWDAINTRASMLKLTGRPQDKIDVDLLEKLKKRFETRR